MARRPREDAPGAAHHVMLRGIERREIFRDDEDRREFLRRISQLAPELRFDCFAWALMPNHVHLVVRSNVAPLSRLMARLGTGYARYFNERHDRVGHLFQNRFRSRLAVDDADLLGLVLYVTQNPLEAARVADATELARHPWCGLGGLLGLRAPHPFEAVQETLALFAEDPVLARVRLRARLDEGAPLDDSPLAQMAAAQRKLPREEPHGWGALVAAALARHGVTAEELWSLTRRPRVAAVRAEVARGATSQLGLSAAETARRLGLSAGAVSAMLVRKRPV